MDSIDKIISKEIILEKQDKKIIRGIVFGPEGEGRYPAVIFSHGFGATYSDLLHIGVRGGQGINNHNISSLGLPPTTV